MASVKPLSMSSTKDELLKNLNMPPETYALMAASLTIFLACLHFGLPFRLDLRQEMRLLILTLSQKETDRIYAWLTSDSNHLKANCKRKPPYDWSDILEKSKDEAMAAIANGGDMYSAYYWGLAAPTDGCPNWIARWFLYHKFRYRDGRNRTQVRGPEERRHHESRPSRHHRSRGHHDSEYSNQEDYYQEGSMTPGTGSSYDQSASSSAYHNDQLQSYSSSSVLPSADTQAAGSYYDPVRDV